MTAMREDVAEIFGDLTVAGAIAERERLIRTTPADLAALVEAHDRVTLAPWHEWRAVVADLDEPTRRRLVLVLLDVEFLRAVAFADLGDPPGAA